MTASCRRRRPRLVHHASWAWVCLAATTVSVTAWAADLPPSYCPITRAPVLSWLRLAKGDDCSFDEDGNGLDDEIEAQLATCFVPEVVFDSAENALRMDEPHVLFSAYPVGPTTIRLNYAFLVAHAREVGPEDIAPVEVVAVEVNWIGRDRRWFGAFASMRTSGPADVAQTSLSNSAPPAFSGTHPVLYATAGKHHWLHRSASLSYACNCGPLGRCGQVRDRADGAGMRVIPGDVRHAPGFYLDSSAAASTHRVRSQSPLDQDGRGFGNLCVFRATGSVVKAGGAVGSNDLTELGYPGERVFGSCFRGGYGGNCAETVSVARALSWDKPFAAGIGARKLVSLLLGRTGTPAFIDEPDRPESPGKLPWPTAGVPPGNAKH